MEWCKLAAGFWRDRSLVAAEKAAPGAEKVFVRGLALCAMLDSEGVLYPEDVAALAVPSVQRKVDALVEHGLLLLDETDGALTFRSWAAWQADADALARRRRADRARQAKRRTASRDQAPLSRDTDGGPVTSLSRDTSRDVTVPREEERREEPTPPPTTSVAPPASRKTRIPDTWPLTAALLAWGRDHAPAIDGRSETEQWLDYHRAKADTAADWTASWRTWMRRAQADHDRRSSTQRPGTGLAARGPRPSATDERVAQTFDLARKLRAQESA